ncbi:MAG: TIGR01777 family protein [Bacteroidetes bacterium]|nr:TIGR01777 family protein [Bacteroidota bacterium]
MKIVIIGSNGFIGTALKTHLRANNHIVISLSRRLMALPVFQLANMLEGVNVFINLAGAPIIGKWSKEYKRTIFNSRIYTTRKIVEVINQLESPPGLFFSSSAVGIYKDTGAHDEFSADLADDFLGSLCRDWETEALRAVKATRVIIMRTGLVLGSEGGMLQKMLPVFKWGLGGKIASGTQAMSWIHINDVVAAYDFMIFHEEVKGIINLTAPQPTDNERFTKLLAKILKRPGLFPVPAFVLNLMYGEGSVVLTKGQLAIPRKLLEAGFRFQFSDLEPALQDLLIKKSSY